MAGNKKDAVKDDGAREMNGVSFLASGMACEMRAQAAMADRAPARPRQEIAEAWAELASPSGAILAGLMETDNAVRWIAPAQNNYYSLRMGFLAGAYDPEKNLILAKGLRALAEEIRSVGASPEFVDAGRCYGPMAARQSPTGILYYPLMDCGVRPATTTAGGAKRMVLAGGRLAAANAQRWDAQLNYKTMGLIASASKKVDDEEKKDIAKQLKAQAAAARELGESRRPTTAAMHMAIGELDGADVRGASTLPSLAVLKASVREVLAGDKLFRITELAGSVGPRGSFVEQLSSQAASRLMAAALGSLSVAWAGSSKVGVGAVGGDAAHGLLRGPRAQASALIGVDKKGLGDAASSEELLFEAIWRLDREGLKSRGWHLNEEQTQGIGRAVNAFEGWLALHASGDELARRVFSEAAVLSQREPDALGALVRQEFRENLRGYILGAGALAPRSAIFSDADGALGVFALSNALAGANPYIGLAQWGLRAAKAVEQAREAGRVETGDDPVRMEMVEALKDFVAAANEATAVFANAAIEAAQPIENAWMEAAGLSAPWRQASAMGMPSQESMLWAMDNPLGANLSSSDPMARMGAKLSRALGIAPGADAEVSAAAKAELGEWGLDDAGWQALEKNPELRGWLEIIVGAVAGKGKVARELSLAAAPVACQAISAGARVGMDPKAMIGFAQCLSAMTANEKRQVDEPLALTPKMRSSYISTGAEALIAAELGQAKALSLPRVYDALARDWTETLDEHGRFGVSSGEAVGSERLLKFVQFLSKEAQRNNVDWRVAGLFESQPIWELLGGSSARLGAVVSAAKGEGGLARWCSALVDRYGVRDAADSNDLIGKVKAKFKEVEGVGEGAWKLAIKDPVALDLFVQAFKTRDSNDELRMGSAGFLNSKAPSEARGARTVATRLALAFNSAAALGVSAGPATAVAAAFIKKRSSDRLFSDQLYSVEAHSVGACLFFAQEDAAKSKRMPKIFKEACVRFERLDKDWREAKNRGDEELPLTGAEAIESEIGDLTDWIINSEHGIWQTLPEQPTWGQLSRLSRGWHQEQAAKAADMAARKEAVEKEKAEELRWNPFLPSSGEHWAAVLGKHSREGWEAVELTSQAQLTEEGSAMSHCVSSYSSNCRTGALRIFSIQLNGQRKCTMELSSKTNLGDLGEDANFSITQNKGAHNAAVTNLATRAFCDEVVAAANAAWSIGWRERQAAKAAAKKAAKDAAKDADSKTGEAEIGDKAAAPTP